MFERFTDRARTTMQLANQEAQRHGSAYIEPCHILIGLLKEGGGIAHYVLSTKGVSLKLVRDAMGEPTEKTDLMLGKLPQTPAAKKVIEHAMEEARSLNHDYVGTEHILLGALRDPGIQKMLDGPEERVKEIRVSTIAYAAGDRLSRNSATPTAETVSLRDYLAVHSGILPRLRRQDDGTLILSDLCHRHAELAYQWADLMLAVRQRAHGAVQSWPSRTNAEAMLACMSDDERSDVFCGLGRWCRYCGREHLPCHCQNDE